MRVVIDGSIRERDSTGKFATVPLDVKFWGKVKKTDDPDGCWEWFGSINPDKGYGLLCLTVQTKFVNGDYRGDV